VPWIANDPDALDRWSGYESERRELATFMDSIGVADQLVVLSGDAHMVALDDGTHNHYGQPGGGGFPVVHAAALDRRGSTKGGPYTHGPYPNRVTLFGQNDGQFVLMNVEDDGGEEVCITWTGHRVPYDAQRTVELVEWSKCFPADP
jgi:alkaline phosphatase D